MIRLFAPILSLLLILACRTPEPSFQELARHFQSAVKVQAGDN